jgi:phospholipid/cholesterol/gamma-HCH transport system ATP-binding protein
MIRFVRVTKSFGERTILRDLSFQVEEGEILFLLGASGTGKSVLLKTLVGLLRTDDGEIWFDGQRIDPLSEDEYLGVRQKCGMVFQSPALFDSISVFENVAYGLRRLTTLDEDEIAERVSRSLDLVRLGPIQSLRPQDLSFGMQKRVSLARTIATQPKVLLFDEPTTGLDPVTTTAINELIRDLSRELRTTSIVVSHDMECALAIADRIIVLEAGRIVESGTPNELLRSSAPLVREFLAEVRKVDR